MALALQERAGVDEVTIYERETSETLPQKLGHGLILMENGVSALASIGCADVLADSKPLRRAVIRTPGAALRDEAMGAVYSVTRAAIVEGLHPRVEARTAVARPAFQREVLGHGDQPGLKISGKVSPTWLELSA